MSQVPFSHDCWEVRNPVSPLDAIRDQSFDLKTGVKLEARQRNKKHHLFNLGGTPTVLHIKLGLVRGEPVPRDPDGVIEKSSGLFQLGLGVSHFLTINCRIIPLIIPHSVLKYWFVYEKSRLTWS